MGAIYGVGAVIGWTPQQVNEQSLWQFLAATEGYREAHNPDGDKELSVSEADELWDWINS